MARIPMEAFEEGTEIVRVYLAARLEEAQAVEQALDDAGLEYGAEAEDLTPPSAFRARRRGVGFWVDAPDADRGVEALERAGLVEGLVRR
jgi:hypothetical protein